jgi:hypothetical protein
VRLRNFDIYTLSAQQVQYWNLCHLRPGVYPNHFKKHMCEKLILDFVDLKDVEPFKRSVLKLRIRALGLPRASPVVSRGNSSLGAEQPRPPIPDPYSPNPNPAVDNDRSSGGYTIIDEEGEAALKAASAEGQAEIVTMPFERGAAPPKPPATASGCTGDDSGYFSRTAGTSTRKTPSQPWQSTIYEEEASSQSSLIRMGEEEHEGRDVMNRNDDEAYLGGRYQFSTAGSVPVKY